MNDYTCRTLSIRTVRNTSKSMISTYSRTMTDILCITLQRSSPITTFWRYLYFILIYWLHMYFNYVILQDQIIVNVARGKTNKYEKILNVANDFCKPIAQFGNFVVKMVWGNVLWSHIIKFNDINLILKHWRKRL